MISATMDLGAINAKLDGITKAAQGAVREAAQAGAEIFYVEMKMRVPVSADGPHMFYGTTAKKAPKGSKKQYAYEFKQGNLRDSIYQFYNTRLSTKQHAVYSVSWNHKKAPYGYMVEYGTSRAPAHPFLRSAYSSVRTQAEQVVLATLAASIAEATK